MIRKLVLLAVLVLFCHSVQAETFGIGVILGEPSGVSAKLWIGDKMAIDLAAAWSFVDESAFQLHADYLFHFMELIKVSKGKLPLYFGVGGRMKFGKDMIVSVRIPVGLAYMFAGAPVDIFLEVGPMLNIVPATEFDIGGGIGVRYFF